MKYFFNSIFVFVFVVFITSLTVYADYSWYDEWLDTYDERNPDNTTNYDSFKKDLMYYDGIVINQNNESAFMTTFANYVVTNVDDGSSYLGAIQDGVNALKNGSLSSKGFVTFLKDVCSYSGINYQSLLKETSNDVARAKGYELVPTLNKSKLADVYFKSSDKANWCRGQIGNKKLCQLAVYRGSGNSAYTWVTDDLGTYNFVFADSVFYNPSNAKYYQKNYSCAISLTPNVSTGAMAYATNNSGSRVNVNRVNYSGSGGAFNNAYIQYGAWNGSVGDATYFYIAVSNSDDYAFIPIFYANANLTSYLSGNSNFYTNPMLKGLDVPEDFDYVRLQKIINDSIDNGNWVTSIDLQKIINISVTDYLESININTRDILLSIQLGLIDNINNEPYLKQIRDLQIINNEKLDILIELIRNGGVGSGGSGSINLDEVSRRLDTIIDILNKPNLPPIDLTPDDPELPNFSVLLMDKFPFSIPYDIALMVNILGVEPVKPDIQIGFPIMGSDEVFLTSVDLSWFDEIRPLLFWFIDFGYLIFLLMLSMKIMEGVRR